MKILIWSQHFWPENFIINGIVKELCDQGHEVTVLTGKPNYPKGDIYEGYKAWGTQYEAYGDAEVIRVPLIPRGRGTAFYLFLNYISFVTSAYLFSPFLLRKKTFDFVFVYGTSPILQSMPAIFIAWIKKAKFMVWVQDLWPESLESTGFVNNRALLKIVDGVVKYIYRRSKSIFITSEFFRSSIEAKVLNIPIIHLPNPAGDLLQNLVSSQPALDLAQEISSYFSLVFAGNIGRVQSVETIVSAANILKSYSDIRYYLIGSGSNLDAIREKVNALQLSNVIIAGEFPYTDMGSLLASASGLIVSLKDSESLSKTVPCKIQSYFSAGRPIIGSLNGEGSELILKAQAGFVCSAEDDAGLAKRILQLYKMTSDERQKLGENGRSYYEHYYSLPVIVKKLTGCMEN